MYRRDFYLYALMELAANDFIRQYGDINDYLSLFDYLAKGVSEYCNETNFKYFPNSKEFFDFARGFLSDNISDEEIKFML